MLLLLLIALGILPLCLCMIFGKRMEGIIFALANEMITKLTRMKHRFLLDQILYGQQKLGKLINFVSQDNNQSNYILKGHINKRQSH